MWNDLVLKANVIHSGIGEWRMRTSLAYQAAYITGVFLNYREQYIGWGGPEANGEAYNEN